MVDGAEWMSGMDKYDKSLLKLKLDEIMAHKGFALSPPIKHIRTIKGADVCEMCGEQAGGHMSPRAKIIPTTSFAPNAAHSSIGTYVYICSEECLEAFETEIGTSDAQIKINWLNIITSKPCTIIYES